MPRAKEVVHTSCDKPMTVRLSTDNIYHNKHALYSYNNTQYACCVAVRAFASFRNSKQNEIKEEKERKNANDERRGQRKRKENDQSNRIIGRLTMSCETTKKGPTKFDRPFANDQKLNEPKQNSIETVFSLNICCYCCRCMLRIVQLLCPFFFFTWFNVFDFGIVNKSNSLLLSPCSACEEVPFAFVASFVMTFALHAVQK